MYRDTTAACDAATYGSVFLKALHFAPKELLTFHSEQGIQYFPISLAEKRKKGRWTRLLYTLCVCARAGIGIFVILQYMYYFPLLVFFFLRARPNGTTPLCRLWGRSSGGPSARRHSTAASNSTTTRTGSKGRPAPSEEAGSCDFDYSVFCCSRFGYYEGSSYLGQSVSTAFVPGATASPSCDAESQVVVT